MIAIGILLLLAAVGTAAMVATGGSAPALVTFGAFRVENTTAFFFFAGAVCAAVLVVGTWTVWRGFVRWRERGQELQRLRLQTAGTTDLPDPNTRERAEYGVGSLEPTSPEALAGVETAPLRTSRSARADELPIGEFPADEPSTNEPTNDSREDFAHPFTDRPVRRSRLRRARDADDTPVPHGAGSADDEVRT